MPHCPDRPLLITFHVIGTVVSMCFPLLNLKCWPVSLLLGKFQVGVSQVNGLQDEAELGTALPLLTNILFTPLC